jgi:hypothetical protein
MTINQVLEEVSVVGWCSSFEVDLPQGLVIDKQDESVLICRGSAEPTDRVPGSSETSHSVMCSHRD